MMPEVDQTGGWRQRRMVRRATLKEAFYSGAHNPVKEYSMHYALKVE